jgi:hypothetical protein
MVKKSAITGNEDIFQLFVEKERRTNLKIPEELAN